MKTLALALIAVSLAGCATLKAKTYHTAAITAPSVTPVKSSISDASRQSQETSQHISDIKRGTDRVDYKASRALRFFP